MSYKIGAVSTARISDDAITSAKLADDSVLAASLATDSVTADAVIADGIGASEISANAVGASELADDAVDTDSIADAAVTSAKLAASLSVTDLAITGNLTVTGDSSAILLEELKVDEATMTLNRQDSTTMTALVAAGDIGMIVKGGSDKDLKMVFDKPAGTEGRINFQDEDDAYIPLKAAGIAGTTADFSGNVVCGSGVNAMTYSSGSGNLTNQATVTAAAFSGPLTGNVTGNCSGSSATCSGLAGSATVLASARSIGGTSFNGSADIAIALAATASTLATARSIGGTSFNGSADIVPATITVADTNSGTCNVGLWEATTGNIGPKTDPGLTYSAVTGLLTASGGFAGALTGNASTASTAAAWTTARTISLAGDLSGSVAIDGSANVTLTATVASDTVALGTDTTGNYVQSLACSNDAITVANGVAEGGAATLAISTHLEGVHDAVSGLNSGLGPQGAEQYMILHQNGSTAAQVTGSSFLNLITATTEGALRSSLGMGTGLYGDLRTASKPLVESYVHYKPGHGSYSSTAAGNEYKATYLLHGTNTGAVVFHLPAIDDSDTTGQKLKLGQKFQVKVTALGSGGSITLTLPSGVDDDTKIDGEDTFSLSEANQSITVMAGEKENAGGSMKPQYFIV